MVLKLMRVAGLVSQNIGPPGHAARRENVYSCKNKANESKQSTVGKRRFHEDRPKYAGKWHEPGRPTGYFQGYEGAGPGLWRWHDSTPGGKARGRSAGRRYRGQPRGCG